MKLPKNWEMDIGYDYGRMEYVAEAQSYEPTVFFRAAKASGFTALIAATRCVEQAWGIVTNSDPVKSNGLSQNAYLDEISDMMSNSNGWRPLDGVKL